MTSGKLMTKVSDCRISQVVNIKKGIHCLNPKDVKGKEDMERPTGTPRSIMSPTPGTPISTGAMDDASRHDQAAPERHRATDAYGLASAAMDCRVGNVSGAIRTCTA